ncbi:hypothetical protein [Frankia sp. AgKG'84/4]|uniref:hypothetical protein n=1 Tax=Frankia sp. AgKG'84/4 TaxID=573490 RepID=UPI00200D8FBD|nr:hypothetical protein [Frankia sp. AgKG'84/4]MCL9795336.1 hypothetical protein [Frankia sp. AgKG'84/4]
MAPGTSEFEGSDQRLPAGAHPSSDARRADRNTAGPAFPAELRGLLGVEMGRHRPDSDHIRRRIAAATGYGPYLGPFPAPDVFTPYDGTESPAPVSVASSARDRLEFATVVMARHTRPINVDDHDDLDPVVADQLAEIGRSSGADRPEPDLDGPADTADTLARRGRVLRAVRFGSDDQDEPVDPLPVGDWTTTDYPATAGSPAPLYATDGGQRARHRGPQQSRRPRAAGSRPGIHGRRRGFVSAIVAVLGLTMASALTLFGLPGSDSLDPSTSTVTAPPHPSSSAWTSTTATGAPPTTPSASPAVPPAGEASDRSSAPLPKSSIAPGTTGSRPADATRPDAPAADAARILTPAQTGIYTATADRFPAGSRVQLSAASADWMLFGGGWEGVQARAALPIPLLKALVVGTPVGSASGFDWIGGFPAPFGVNKTDRLSVRGTATLTTYVLGSRSLEIYLGSPSGQVRITVGSVKDSRSFVVGLPEPQADGSSDALIRLTLPAGIGLTTVSIAGVGSAPWTLAAAVLR